MISINASEHMVTREVLTTADEERWRELLPASACVMGSLEYARIMERQTGCAARLFVAEGPADARAAYPFLLRPVDTLPFAARLGAGRFDIFTPEYTGPLQLVGPLGSAIGPRFVDLFGEYCREQGIVAEFAHLDPFDPAPGSGLLDEACVEVNREIVYLDLTWGEERLWARSYSTDVRRNLRIASEAGVRIRRAETAEDVREFHRLYTLTMERRKALERYHFPLSHFLAFFETLPENAVFLLAEYETQTVAAGLLLYDDTDVYWHLSGADMEFAAVRAVNAYLHHAIRWAADSGRQRLVLGGAYSPRDGVFRFKASFSPLRAQFRTYRRIHDPALYAALTREWSAANGGAAPSDGFFPAYRSASGAEGHAAAP